MFHKETEYALRSLVYIQTQNAKGRWPGLVEIATEIEAPSFYTAKILQKLVRQGFINSQKGRGGGFYFDPAKPELTLRELIVSIEGDKIFTQCGFGLKKCNDQNPCPLHHRFAPVRHSLNQLVLSETVQSLARNHTPSRS